MRMHSRNNDIFDQLIKSAVFLPDEWKKYCPVNKECTFHQIAPYIGKIKSSIAKNLIHQFSLPGDYIVDPFAGSGTIPFEALLQSRKVYASDINPYAKVITKAKLFAPNTLSETLNTAEKLLSKAESLQVPDLRKVPLWVRSFFHPRTLKEAINFANISRQKGYEFIFACFLSILHHQRPGFLSYPCSNLVPYLREKKFPRDDFPEMYTYRDLRSRLISKINRVFKNPPFYELNLKGEIWGQVNNVRFFWSNVL